MKKIPKSTIPLKPLSKWDSVDLSAKSVATSSGEKILLLPFVAIPSKSFFIPVARDSTLSLERDAVLASKVKRSLTRMPGMDFKGRYLLPEFLAKLSPDTQSSPGGEMMLSTWLLVFIASSLTVSLENLTRLKTLPLSPSSASDSMIWTTLV